jgi:hypothetical protein
MNHWIATREKTNTDAALTLGVGAGIFLAAFLPSANYESDVHSTRKAQALDAMIVGFRRAVGNLPTPADDAGLLLAGRVALVVVLVLVVAKVALSVRHRQARRTTARDFAAGGLTAPVYPPLDPDEARVARLTIEATMLPGGDVVLHGVDRDPARLAQGATPEYWVRASGRELRASLCTDDLGLLALLQANGTRLAERGETTFLQQQGVPFQVRVAS